MSANLPRLFKEISLIKPYAITEGIDDASQTATKYITTISNNGIMVHRANQSTTGVQITDSVDIMRSGVSTANFGGSDGTSIRLGPVTGKHTLTDSNGLSVYDGTNEIAHFDEDDVTFLGGLALIQAEAVYDEHNDRVGSWINIYNDAEDRYATGATVIRMLTTSSHNLIGLIANNPNGGSISQASRITLSRYASGGCYIRLNAEDISFSNPYNLSGSDIQLGDPEKIEVYTDSSSPTSVSSGTDTTLKSIGLPPGKWLVCFKVQFASNSSGRRAAHFTPNSSDTCSSTFTNNAVAVAAVSGGATIISHSSIIVVTGSSNTTYYLRCYQNSGSSLDCGCVIRAIRQH